MARMIPSTISPEVKSNAERRIFDWFKTGNGTGNWIVLHSLGIANHNKLIYGEMDFLVLAPGYGLFALEVKGGRVSRTDGVWQFTNRYNVVNRKERGPFEQAWDGVYSIINNIKSKLDYNHRYLSKLIFGIGVMFPDIEYTASGSDEEQWQVFDKNNNGDIYNYIKCLSENTVKKLEEKYQHLVTPERKMTADDANYVAGLLRGDFDYPVSAGILIKQTEQKMIALTEEQYQCIDQLEDNKRCLIYGCAGTGKTLIAIQEAMRAVAEGRKTALLCYNKNLGLWLNKCFPDASLKPEYIGTFHKYLLDTLSSNNIDCPHPRNDNEMPYFYRETLPDLALPVLKDSFDKYDDIIIDEAQDLINTKYLDVIDDSVTGGLSRGRWRMFGDFSMQAIYSDGLSSDAMFDMLEERTSFIKFRLTINCRNTKPICEEICTITGFEPPGDMWMKVDGLPVNFITYNNDEERVFKLQVVIEELISNGVSPCNITVLSPVRYENSTVKDLRKYRIREYNTGESETISFCTIQSFKGLENTVIILIDVESFDNKQLMYVALSRAVAGLYIILDNKAMNEYISLKQRRLLK